MAEAKMVVEVGIRTPQMLDEFQQSIHDVLKAFMETQENLMVSHCVHLVDGRVMVLNTRTAPCDGEREVNDAELDALQGAMEEGGLTVAVLARNREGVFFPMDFEYEGAEETE